MLSEQTVMKKKGRSEAVFFLLAGLWFQAELRPATMGSVVNTIVFWPRRETARTSGMN